MKKLLFSLSFAFALSGAYAQNNVIWSDNFNDEDASDWTFYDEDGDGLEWSVVQILDNDGEPVNTPVLRSFSWLSTPLTPNNYAVTPAIDLTNVSGEITLSWQVSAADAQYADEKYTVYVATGNAVADFLASNVSFSELVTDNGPAGTENFYTKTLDISAFAGQTIYVAFRHHDTSDEFSIEIDNVSVYTNGDGGGEPNDPTYCDVALNCSDDDVILNVNFAGIDNSSGCSLNGYGDYTTSVDPAHVMQGETYELSVEVGAGWFERVSAWIDYNNNGVFDADEFLGEIGEGGTGGVMTSSITIPENVADGLYRMRILAYATGSNNPAEEDPCINNDEAYGEYEDYLVKVGEDLELGNVTLTKVGVYPNPVADSFKLNLDSKFNAAKVTVNVTDLNGKLLKTFANANSYNVSELPAGVYIVTVTDGVNTSNTKIVKK